MLTLLCVVRDTTPHTTPPPVQPARLDSMPLRKDQPTVPLVLVATSAAMMLATQCHVLQVAIPMVQRLLVLHALQAISANPPQLTLLRVRLVRTLHKASPRAPYVVLATTALTPPRTTVPHALMGLTLLQELQPVLHVLADTHVVTRWEVWRLVLMDSIVYRGTPIVKTALQVNTAHLNPYRLKSVVSLAHTPLARSQHVHRVLLDFIAPILGRQLPSLAVLVHSPQAGSHHALAVLLGSAVHLLTAL
jgi:hypothetical protein